jgi:hypothetical protein
MAVSEYSAYLVDWPVCSRDRNGEAIDFFTKSDRVVVRLLNAADRRKIRRSSHEHVRRDRKATVFAFNPAVPESPPELEERTALSHRSRPATVPVFATPWPDFRAADWPTLLSGMAGDEGQANEWSGAPCPGRSKGR